MNHCITTSSLCGIAVQKRVYRVNLQKHMVTPMDLWVCQQGYPVLISPFELSYSWFDLRLESGNLLFYSIKINSLVFHFWFCVCLFVCLLACLLILKNKVWFTDRHSGVGLYFQHLGGRARRTYHKGCNNKTLCQTLSHKPGCKDFILILCLPEYCFQVYHEEINRRRCFLP